MGSDILIVSAGPAGLMMANQLARRGIRVHLIDRNAHASRELRALGAQSRTPAIYRKPGIIGRALKLGRLPAAVTSGRVARKQKAKSRSAKKVAVHAMTE